MLNGLLNEQRTQQSLQQDYAVKLAVEKNRWNKRRMQFEHNRLNMFLPSRHGTYSTGTSYIQHYVSRPDHTGTTLQVGQCLADVVDAIDGLANRGMRLERFNEKFVPPPDPFRTDPATGESVPQRQQRLEKDLRHEIEQLNRSIRTSEESRSNAWKRMLRTKAEFGIPHDISVGSGPPKFVQVDMSNALTISLPVLRQTTTMNIDQSSNVASNPTMGSYTPAARRVANPRRPPVARPRSPVSTPAKEPSKSPTGTSVDTGAAESKYSLARVKERIAADGTVAPVSEPKLTKDGLYMRPAGRTRKGMNWDAIRGIWIPGPGYSVSNDDDD